MKRAISSIVVAFIAILTFGQNTPQSNGEIHQTNAYEVARSNNPLPTASIVSLQKNFPHGELTMQYEGEHVMEKCNTYRNMKIAGIVLSAVGGGLIVSGSIIRGMAYRQNTDGTITNYDYNNAMAGGGAMIGVGVMSLGAGIPLAIIGSIKTHKYCYGGDTDHRGY